MLSQKIQPLLKTQAITLNRVLQQVGASGFGVIIALTALPSALPLPAPGYSVPFGLTLVILALQVLLGRTTPWLPARVKQQSINLVFYQKKSQRIIKFIQFFEYFIHPRWNFMFGAQNRLLALALIMCGLLMCIPIPGTNTIPALGAFSLGLAMIEKDGLLAMIGILFALLGTAVAYTIIFMGTQLLRLLF